MADIVIHGYHHRDIDSGTNYCLCGRKYASYDSFLRHIEEMDKEPIGTLGM